MTQTQTRTLRRLTRQTGTTLIEIMVAVVLIGVGLAAEVKLQSNIIGETGYAKAETLAINLAQQKLDDLKSYKQTTSETGLFAYQAIADNTGGTLDANNILNLPADASTSDGVNVVANVDYALSWAVNDYYYYDTDADSIADQVNATTYAADTGAPIFSYPHFKQVALAVSWNDENGALQSTSLEGLIELTSPADASKTVNPNRVTMINHWCNTRRASRPISFTLPLTMPIQVYARRPAILCRKRGRKATVIS